MPNNTAVTEAAPQPQNSGTSQEHTLSILMQKVLGQDNTPNLTEKQVDELLSQRREITSYIHEDKKRESRDSKFGLVTILVFILLFSGLVLWKYPGSFSEVLSLLIGLFGGAFGGYGYGKKQQ